MTNRVVYYTNEGFVDPDGSYRIALVEENEPGYTPSKFSHPAIEGARELVDQLNRELGYDSNDMLDVVASSMAAQNAAAEFDPLTVLIDSWVDDYSLAGRIAKGVRDAGYHL